MLENFLQSQLNGLAADVEDVWFQQDGDTAHNAQRTIHYLRELLPKHIISLSGNIHWLTQSPNLVPCNFFLWSYLKRELHKHPPHNVVELKMVI